MSAINFADNEPRVQFTSVKSPGVMRDVSADFVEDEEVSKKVKQCNFACGANFRSKHIYKFGAALDHIPTTTSAGHMRFLEYAMLEVKRGNATVVGVGVAAMRTKTVKNQER